MKLECANCGAQYPGDLHKHWGKTEETNGYGPSPVCTKLVPTQGSVDKATAEGREINRATDPHEVCGGLLGAIADTAADAARLITLTLNGETAR